MVAVTFSLMSIHWGWSPWLRRPALACCSGALSGGARRAAFTAWSAIQPFIATLAMMCSRRGLAKTISAA